jgi:hypothetical protein
LKGVEVCVSKLLSLKEWVTLNEAAKHLSSVFDEEVSVADLYRFALVGRLRLTANFVNHAKATLGHKLRIRDAGFRVMPSLAQAAQITTIDLTAEAMPEFEAWLVDNEEARLSLAEAVPKSKFVMLNGQQISATECLQFDDSVSYIDGLWDLAMIGAERLDIENALQEAFDGPEITLICLDGVVVNRPDGRFASLKWRFEKRGENDKDPDAYYPAGSLPADAPVVVRPQALLDFIAGLDTRAERPIDERERGSLLRIIRALDVMAGLPARGAAPSIELQLQQLGFSRPADSTIRKVIEQSRALPPDKPQ